jgi:serine/threonine-protein kinase
VSNKSDTAPDGNVGRRLLDQYVLLEKIGEGGMGAVYLAEQPTMGRRAVVKLLHPSLSGNAEVAARFNLEARAAAALNHPHIVTVYNYGALPDGGLFLAMEHLEGRSLERAIEESARLSPARAVHVARQICEALAEAHARGVVHRVLMPSNVMLVTRGRDDEFVKVLDFGIAKVRGVALTRSGTLFGTPEYMSPEQLRGRALDGRSDLYALGVVLFEMLTGRLPFDCATSEAFMAAHLEMLPPSLSAAAPDLDVPPELEALVARALAKDAAARPASAEEMAELLAAASGATPSTAVGGKRSDPPGRGRRAVGEREAGLRAALAGALVAVLALAALVLLLATRRPAHPPTVPTTSAASDRAPTISAPPRASPATTPSTADEDARSVDELEREFLAMKSPLSTSDRRAALRALVAHVDQRGGSAAERAQMKRAALLELIRQHAN